MYPFLILVPIYVLAIGVPCIFDGCCRRRSPEETLPRRSSAGDRPTALPLCTFAQLKGAAAAATCTVCLGEYKDSEWVRVLPECYHVFHRACIDQWLSVQATCPLCRNSPPGAPLPAAVAAL